jgi:hypothetical protein
MGDSDSSILDSEITLGSEMVISTKPTPEGVVSRNECMSVARPAPHDNTPQNDDSDDRELEDEDDSDL